MSFVEDPVAAARSTITELLQKGNDESACADLAATTIKEVVDSVDATQKVTVTVTVPVAVSVAFVVSQSQSQLRPLSHS